MAKQLMFSAIQSMNFAGVLKSLDHCEGRSRQQKALLQLYTLSFYISLCVFALMRLWWMLDSLDLKVFTESMIITLPSLMGVFKFTISALRRQKTWQAIALLREADTFRGSTPQRCRTVQRWLRLETLMKNLFLCTGTFVISVYILENLSLDGLRLIAKENSIFHQAPAALRDNLWFTLWQVINLYAVCYACSAIDITLTSLFTCLISHLDTLHQDLESQDQSLDHLIHCIEYHKRIARCMKELNYIFSPIMIPQVMYSSSYLCVTLYQLAMVPLRQTSSVAFLNHWAMIIAGVGELSVICWLGNVVKSKSHKVGDLVYCRTWYSLPLATRKLYLTFIKTGQRQFIFAEHRVFTMTFETFLSVMQASYSFFSVLKGLHRTKH